MVTLERHIVFLTLAGSHAHGTARPCSDVDLRGVCIAPLAARLALFNAFEQYEGELSGEVSGLAAPRLSSRLGSAANPTRHECVIFDIAKFARLCAAANPNALEILFADEKDWVFETPAWRRFQGERHRFLTRKVQQTFLGYAIAQLQKIKTHRAWLLNPPLRRPAREDFGLPRDAGTLSRDDQHRIEQSIADKMRSYGIDDIEMPRPTRVAVQERLTTFCRDLLSASADDLDERRRALATHALTLPSDVAATLNAEKKYRSAMKHWESYQTWKRQRNPARADLERQHGYDTKHAMHLVRLMRMGLEALELGDLRVRREDAAELSAIRDGALSFDELQTLATQLQEDMDRAATRTALRADVDYEHVNELAVELMLATLE